MQAAPTDYFTVTEHGGNGRKIVFIFGGWKSRAILYKPLLHDLVKRNFKCILYIPKPNLIAVGTPYSEIVTASHVSVEDVRRRVRREKLTGAVSFSTIGVSLGTIFATQSAKMCPGISRLLLLAPFGDFAEHVMLWPKHRYFSKVLASQPTSQKESGEVLNQVALHKNIDHLKGKRIFVGYATHDVSTHTEVTERFLAILEKNQLTLEVSKVKGGHLSGIFKNLFISRPYIKFLSVE